MTKNDKLRDLLNEIKLRYQLGEGDYLDGLSSLSNGNQFEENVDNEQLEFVLQLKIRELKKLTGFLHSISLKVEKERNDWLDNNQHFFGQLTHLIILNSNLSLSALKSDEHNSHLSLILAEEVKRAITLMNTLFYDDGVIDG